MSGLHEVACESCARRYETSAEQARAQRVVRCPCGQFVRLDRALVERRSDPVPSQPPPAPSDDDDDDEQESTHLLSSLSEVAAVRARAQARASLASLHGSERPSRPAPPNNPLRSLSPAPLKRPSSPPTDKPLWYVDLGGSETVEMTIEQLIVARRSGKLGEGALVWREGMPRWRPVGTLIPAIGVAGRPTPLPSAPSQPPVASRTPLPSRPASPSRPRALPSRPEVPTPQSLASYERPLATLEFALEKPVSLEPVGALSPSPSKPRQSTPPPRSLTPVPRPDTWTKSVVAALPRPAPPPPPVELADPVPAVERASLLTPLLPPPATLTTPSAPVSFSTDHPTRPPASRAAELDATARPRWVSAGIALLVCVTASSAGALLVRTLKLHREPSSLAASAVSPLPSATARVPRKPTVAPAPVAPMVVDLESLSVERKPRRAAPRALPLIAAPAPAATTATESNASGAAAATPTPAPKAKNSDLPAAAPANPYTTGSDEPGP